MGVIKRISSTRKAVVGHGRIRPRASCFVGKSIISKIFPESRAAKDLKNEWFEYVTMRLRRKGIVLSDFEEVVE